MLEVVGDDPELLEAIQAGRVKIVASCTGGSRDVAVKGVLVKDKSNYLVVPTGQALNKLIAIRADNEKYGKKDIYTGAATFKGGELTLELKNYDEIAGLRISTKQLLQALMATWEAAGRKNGSVAMSLDDYMSLRKLSDRKEARKQLQEDLKTLYNCSFKFYSPQKAMQVNKRRKNGDGLNEYNCEMRIISSKMEEWGITNSVVYANFTEEFRKLMSRNFLQLPSLAWALNGKHNANAFYFLQKLSQLKNMQHGLRNEDIITVKALLQSSPNMPTYEEATKNHGSVRQKIYTRMEKGLDTLQEFLSWDYRDAAGNKLTREEAKALSMHDYEELRIITHWKIEPREE